MAKKQSKSREVLHTPTGLTLKLNDNSPKFKVKTTDGHEAALSMQEHYEATVAHNAKFLTDLQAKGPNSKDVNWNEHLKEYVFKPGKDGKGPLRLNHSNPGRSRAKFKAGLTVEQLAAEKDRNKEKNAVAAQNAPKKAPAKKTGVSGKKTAKSANVKSGDIVLTKSQKKLEKDTSARIKNIDKEYAKNKAIQAATPTVELNSIDRLKGKARVKK